MDYLYFVIGWILGAIFIAIKRSRERIHGIVHVDHNTEQCIFNITSDQLSNRNKKIAVFLPSISVLAEQCIDAIPFSGK